MNTRKLYKNAYRFIRQNEEPDMLYILSRACAIGLMEYTDQIEDVIRAASLSYYHRNDVDPYETWMSDARHGIFARRVFEPIGKALMPIAESFAEVIRKWQTPND